MREMGAPGDISYFSCQGASLMPSGPSPGSRAFPHLSLLDALSGRPLNTELHRKGQGMSTGGPALQPGDPVHPRAQAQVVVRAQEGPWLTKELSKARAPPRPPSWGVGRDPPASWRPLCPGPGAAAWWELPKTFAQGSETWIRKLRDRVLGGRGGSQAL